MKTIQKQNKIRVTFRNGKKMQTISYMHNVHSKLGQRSNFKANVSAKVMHLCFSTHFFLTRMRAVRALTNSNLSISNRTSWKTIHNIYILERRPPNPLLMLRGAREHTQIVY